ncbi:hypothetical protein ACWIG5_33230 [Streptomyces lydicus]
MHDEWIALPRRHLPEDDMGGICRKLSFGSSALPNAPQCSRQLIRNSTARATTWRMRVPGRVALASVSSRAWDSGAPKWTAERRELYANDLDSDRSLVAVSLGSNRSKGDKDPAEWMPPSEFAACTYVTDWVAAKLRWRLAADGVEKTKLKQVAASCPSAKVSWKVAR